MSGARLRIGRLTRTFGIRDMRRRAHLPQSPTSGRWSRLLTAELICGFTLAGAIFYIADAISQNALGQLGVDIIQSLFKQFHIIAIVIWLYGIILLLIVLIVGLFIWVIRKQRLNKQLNLENMRLEQENRRLRQEMRQMNYIIQADENFFRLPPPPNIPEEEGEAHES